MTNDTPRKNEYANSETNEPKHIANLSIEVCTEAISCGGDDIENLSESEEAIKQRPYWVADAAEKQREPKPHERPASVLGTPIQQKEQVSGLGGMGAASGGMGDSSRNGCKEQCSDRRVLSETTGDVSRKGFERSGALCWMDDSESQRWGILDPKHIGSAYGEINASANTSNKPYQQSSEVQIATSGEWVEPEWLCCRDNKYRPIKPGIKPLVDRTSERVVRGRDPGAPINADHTQEARTMRLNGYGNAICAQTAAQFIQAFMSTL